MTEQQAYEKRWWMLGVMILSIMVVSLDNTILNVALPTIERTLHASQSQQEWIIDSYILVFAGLLLAAGVLGDRIGRRKVLLGGMAIFGLGSLASAFATSAIQLIETRALMGVGGAAIMPATLAIITRVFEPHERGKAIGIWAGVSGIGIAVGPITGGALLSAHFWWGSVFLINVPVAILALVLIPFLVPESKDPAPSRTDFVGTVSSIAGLGMLVYGIIKGGSLGSFTDVHVLAPLLVSVVLLAHFVHHELTAAYPMIDVRLFANAGFSAASTAVSLVFFALMGATFFLTYYLQFVRDYTPLQAGVRLVPIAVAMLIFAPRSSHLVARFGTRIVCTAGMLIVTLGFACYQLIDVHTSIWVVEVMLFIVGTGMATAMAPATTAIMALLPRDRAGAGSAVNNTTRQVGGALGVAILGSVLSASYRGQVSSQLGVLPAPLRRTAGESIGATTLIAKQVGGPALSLIEPAKVAFVHAMHFASIGSGVMAFLGALIAARFLPGHAEERAETTAVSALSAQRLSHAPLNTAIELG